VRAQIAAAALAAAGLLSAATQASASVPRVALAAVYNSNAEAGQYVQSSGIHFRDVRATFTLTQAQESVSDGGTLNATDGGIGIQLCNPGTGQAIQFAAVPVGGGVFDFAYQIGQLAQTEPASTRDACATGGILSTTALDPGFVSYDSAPVGDTVSLEIFYDARSGWFSLSVRDPAQGGTESVAFAETSCGRFCGFSEPGAGVRDAGVTGVTPPADILLASFDGLRATQANGKHFPFGHWSTVADSSNPGGSATDAPANVLTADPLDPAGSAFLILAANP